MARGIEKVLPPGLCYLIVTFENRKGQPGGYVSNGERRNIATALKTINKRFVA